MQFVTHSEDETIAVGRELAALLPERAIVSLAGDLGAGKTTLVKGIAAARAGVDPDDVSSPTFTLVHEYGASPRLVYHIDLYRLETARELATLGLEELDEKPALILIEWANRFNRLPLDLTHHIEIHHAAGGQRTITLSPCA